MKTNNAAKNVTTTLRAVKTTCECGKPIVGDHKICGNCNVLLEADRRGQTLHTCVFDGCKAKTPFTFCWHCNRKTAETKAIMLRKYRAVRPDDPRFNTYATAPRMPQLPTNRNVARTAPSRLVSAAHEQMLLEPIKPAPAVPVATTSIDDLDALLDERLETADEYVMPKYVSYSEVLDDALEARLASAENYDRLVRVPTPVGPVVKDIKEYLATRYVVVERNVPAEPAPAKTLTPAEKKAAEIRAKARAIFAEGGVDALLKAGAVVTFKTITVAGAGEFDDPHLNVKFQGVTCEIFDPERDNDIKAARKEVERKAREHKARRAEQSAARSRVLTPTEQAGKTTEVAAKPK